MFQVSSEEVAALQSVQDKIYKQNCKVGWHSNKKEQHIQDLISKLEELDPEDRTIQATIKLLGEYPTHREFGTLIALMHSELSEALEGDRKDLMDEHLPHRKMREVELADCIIRILDAGGREGMDIAGAIAEKHTYNAERADHKAENRKRDNGKKY